MQALGFASNRYMDVPQLVSLINQERSNNKLYVSLVANQPDRLLRRQNAAESAVVHTECDAGGPHCRAIGDDFARERQ